MMGSSSQKRPRADEETCGDAFDPTNEAELVARLRAELALLTKRMEGAQDLLKQKNEKLKENSRQIRGLQQELEEERKKAATLVEDIAQGIVKVMQRIQQFPDVFSCFDKWKDHDDVTCLKHIREFGGESAVTLITQLIVRCKELLRPTHNPYQSPTLVTNVVKIFSVIFEEAMPPGAYQYVPAWSAALVMKTLTHSSRAVDIICREIPGAPGSDMLLHSRLYDAYLSLKQQPEIDAGNFDGNFVAVADNAPKHPDG